MELNKKHHRRRWLLIAGCLVITIIGARFWSRHEAKTNHEIAIATQAKVNSSAASIIGSVPVDANLDSTLKLESSVKSVIHGQLDVSTCISMATAIQDETNSNLMKEQIALAKSAAKLEVDRLLKTAINSLNLQERATALLMNGQLLSEQALQDFRKIHPDCDSDKNCEQTALAVAVSARFESTDQLAKIAIGSMDPSLYATAFHACNSTDLPAKGFCQQISARQWAQRDPENGNAWLYVLTHHPPELQGKANANVDAAMFRLSKTKTFDLEFPLLSKFPKNYTALQSENLLVQQELNEITLGLYMSSSLPAYQHIMNYCKGDLLEDVNRRQVCNQVANNLVDNDGTMLGYTIGKKMGERLEWSVEKLSELREEHDAMRGVELSLLDDLTKPVNSAAEQITQSCQWTVRTSKQLMRRMQLGEIAYLRDLIKHQSLSNAELAANYRVHMQKVKTQTTGNGKP